MKYERVQHVWSLLVCAARDRRTYTYGELADAIGMRNGARAVRYYLAPIMHYCREQQLPPLTVLVVLRDTGVPGEGLTTLKNVNEDRENVFAYDWLQREPPEAVDFEEATHRTTERMNRRGWGQLRG